jgi:uncharacterized protein (DUF302 family)
MSRRGRRALGGGECVTFSASGANTQIGHHAAGEKAMSRFAVVFAAAAISLLSGLAAQAEMLRRESPRPVPATIDRLEAVLRERGFTIFARVDHAAGARSVGQELRPTMLLIFGNPMGGTPMMQAEQTMGLALPLRALAWQDAAGKTWLGYEAMADAAAQRGLSREHPAVGRVGQALAGIVEAVVAP